MADRLPFMTAAVSLSLLAAGSVPASAEGKVNYNRDIRPILSNVCYQCHGPDANERKTAFRLDVKESALGTLEAGGFAIVPGKSAESELLRRITSEDPNERMPPPKFGHQLSETQIALIKQWIDEGAEFLGHWSFIRPERIAPPQVQATAAVRNPIDQFLIARLEREGLAPAVEADKAALIRRVTFDLIGLPPTPAEVDAFLADESPAAYEHLVDRLLASPRYGEHQARYWLDLVRYGDTHGLHLDNERALWLYRDWLINAYNRNLPFDQFTVEQLAGDLLPQPTIEQQIATGFNRCNVTTSEGGSINDEVLVRYAVDRTEALGTIFLGLTVGCAVCHDHKFDPVSQKEFYQLYAFFGSAADAAMDGNQLGPPPILKVPTPEQTAQLAALDAELAATRTKITEELAKVEYVEPATTAPTTEPAEYVWIEDAAPKDSQLQGNSPWEFVAKPDHPVYSGEKSTRRLAEGLSQHFFTGANPALRIGEGDKLFAYVYLDPANPPKEVMLQWNDGAWEHRAYWGENVIPWGAENTVARVAMGPLPKTGEWVRLEVEAAKVGLAAGANLNGWAFTQEGGLCYWDKAGSVTRTPQDGKGFESQLAWEAYDKALTKSDVPGPVREATKVEVAARTPEQQKLIRDYFIENVYVATRATFDPLRQKVTELTQQRTAADAAIPMTMVMADLPQPRDTFILTRGEYDKRGEKVTTGVPSVFPPLPKDAPANRLGLARWLVDPSHPLTARVAVNRYWQQFFGKGIVETAEDFGSQGKWPTHPELLDWLSVEFVESGWNIKQMQKLIVMSGAYRQSSRITPELLQKDPDNSLLARGPRFRLDAEMVRDSALAVSGLLGEQIGGRSVKTYQPVGLWEAIAFQGSNTSIYKRDEGDALYRRSLYMFWKRTAPPPSLMAFDAPSRETCTARRARTNTPLQALVLMNDEQYVEAARHLGRRMIAEGGATAPERLAYGFRLVTARRPAANEVAVLEKILAEQWEVFKADPMAAGKLLGVGESKPPEGIDPIEHATYTMLANLLLNLDETITKE